MKISLIFFSLLSGLSVALVAFMPLVPQRATGRGFFRFNCFLSLVLLACLVPLKPYDEFWLPQQRAQNLLPPINLLQSTVFLFGVYGLFLLILFFLFKNPRQTNGSSEQKERPKVNPIIYVGTIAFGIGALLCDSFLYRPSLGTWWGENIFIPLSLFSSAAFLGSSLFAMLLGHWYLVQFDLDKKLLKRVAQVFVATLVLRCVVIGISLWMFQSSPLADSTSFQSLISMQGHGLFFWMRLGMGIVLPIILAYMIYETAKMGANQACTGLLYIAVIFIFMGEAVSRYIFFLKGIPL